MRMTKRSGLWLVGFCALVGGVGVAADFQLIDAQLRLSGTNIDSTAGSTTLTTVDVVNDQSAGSVYWRRDLWTTDAATEYVVQLDYGDYFSSVTGSEWVDDCVQSTSVLGSAATGPANYTAVARTIAGKSWYFDQTTTNARTLLDAKHSLAVPGQVDRYNYNAMKTIETGEVVGVPTELGDADQIRFLILGARDSGAATTQNVTVTLNFSDGVGTATKNVVVPVSDLTVPVASRNGGASVALTSDGVTFRKLRFGATALVDDGESGADAPACDTTSGAGSGDEVELDNPAAPGGALASYRLVSMSFAYPDDPDSPHLGGPLAVSFAVDSATYDATFRYRGAGVTPASGVDAITAPGNDNAFWYQLVPTVTFPAGDTFSDVYFRLWCDENPNGIADFSLSTPIDLTPSGYRAMAGAPISILDAGVPCEGDFVKVEAEIIAAFDDAPEITGLVVKYDLDADMDGKTAEGLFDPVTNVISASTVVAQQDCNDNNAGILGKITYYTDSDSDGDGSATVNGDFCQGAQPVGTSANNQDCKDSDPLFNRNNPVARTVAESAGAGLDYNCDGSITCYADADSDRDGDAASILTRAGVTGGGSASSCQVPGSYASNADDCNDALATFTKNNTATTRANATPADPKDYDCDGDAPCFVDLDGDTFGSNTLVDVPVALAGTAVCVAGGRSAVSTDCNDVVLSSGSLFFPGATEASGGGEDRNCDHFVTCYRDADADGDGSENAGATSIVVNVITSGATTSCNRTAVQNATASPANIASSTNNLDCDDSSNQFSSTAQANRLTESAGAGADYNCDNSVQCYTDADRDTYGLLVSTITLSVAGTNTVNCVDPASNRAAVGGDCEDTPGVVAGPANDNGELFNPGRAGQEVIGSGLDSDCNGTIICPRDQDGDGFGSTVTGSEIAILTNGVPSGTCVRSAATNTALVATPSGIATVSGLGDCNDSPVGGTLFNTSKTEVDGAGTDYNCGGSIECFADVDRDHEGNSNNVKVTVSVAAGGGSATACERDTGFPNPTWSTNTDCNDSSSLYTTAILDANETVGGTDFNCDGNVRCFPDLDQDGFGSSSPGATPTTLTAAVALGGTTSCNVPGANAADDQNDCNDSAALVFLGASEPAGSQTDFNCSGTIACFQDSDADTWGSAVSVPVTVSPAGGTESCASFGAAPRTGDCNDLADPLDRFRPDSTEEAPGGVTTDFNCDATIRCFVDADADGQGTTLGTISPKTVVAGATGVSCNSVDNQSSNKTDCDDNTTDGSQFFAGAPETPGTGFDNNCDSVVQCFVDSDNDSYGSSNLLQVPGVHAQGVRLNCSSFGADDATDCLDCFHFDTLTGLCSDTLGERTVAAATNPSPARVELLDLALVDENCDNRVGCFPDSDRDGFGNESTVVANSATWVLSSLPAEPVTNGQGQCLTPQGHAATGTDCHDDRAEFFPGAQHEVTKASYQRVGAAAPGANPVTTIDIDEIPGNQYDDDCDGTVLCFYNQDRDAYGLEAALALAVDGVSTDATDLVAWSGTRQTTPGSVGTFDRSLGGTYTCDPTRSEAPFVAGPVFDCNDSNALVFPGAVESDGAGNDNNCDGSVYCFIDADGDGFGGSTQQYPVPGGQQGYISGVSGPALCTSANGFATNGTDCHDNNQFANPSGNYQEIPGDAPLQGDTYNVPGQGLRVVGAGPGQVDYCGNGITSCYGRAFDEDCSSEFDCYFDEDGDGWGTDVTQDPRPTNQGANPTLDCDIAAGVAANRRASVGGVLGSTSRDCHPDVADAHPQRVGGEVTGNAYDDNCDDIVACYRDQDDDGYGIDQAVFITFVSEPSVGTPGFTPGASAGVGSFDCDAVNDMAAIRGAAAAPSFDCHDNYQFANPGIPLEVDGHTAAVGETALVNGLTVTVGTGVGQTDLCGDGSTSCYAAAFDDNCDGLVSCFVDEDGDGVGSARISEAGVVASGTGAYVIYTCDTSSALAIAPNRRSSVGGDPGSALHDCNDNNADVYPTTPRVTAPGEVAGSTDNASIAGQVAAFDENCDGVVACFEDLDQDTYGTLVVNAATTGAGRVFETTTAGSGDKRYDCERIGPAGTRSALASRGGTSGPDRDCHDTNALANPGIASETNGIATWVPTGAEVAYDEDCDGFYTCFRDRDDDEYGTEAYTIAVTDVNYGTIRLLGGSNNDDGFYKCELATADLDWPVGVVPSPITGRGGLGNAGYDCHDNYQFANPGVATEVAGHTAQQGDTVTVAGFGAVTVGVGQFDLCGDGGSACYGVAFDENCDGDVACYVDEDGDGVGSALTTTEGGILPGQRIPADVAGQPITAYSVFTCDTSNPVALDPLRRSSIGGGVGQTGHDCNDVNPDVYPSTTRGPAPTEQPGHTQNTAIPVQDSAFDEDCNGIVQCFEDIDQDAFGTAAVDVPTTGNGRVLDITDAGSDDKRYDCLQLGQTGGRSSYAAVGGDSGADRDCHDTNPAANPGVAAEVPGSTVYALTGDEVAYDENCDGLFDCYRDRDNDGFGTDLYPVPVSNVLFGTIRLAGGSAEDDGFYKCDITVAELNWPANTERSDLTGRGGEGTTRYDCHDYNALANPSVVTDDAGNTPDHLGNTDRAWDANCDGLVQCYRNVDGDAYGTYVVDLQTYDATRPLTSHPALDPSGTYFLCDNNALALSGRGGVGTADFDCHDDSRLASPGIAFEVPGDILDNNCDDEIDCFEDLDNDGFGTRVLHQPPNFFEPFDSASYNPATGQTSDDAGMRLFICGPSGAADAGVALTPADITTLGLDSDEVASVGGDRASPFFDPSGFDCHDANPNANPGVAAETPGEIVDPDLDQLVAFDEDCDGSFSCFRDRDNDGYGTTIVEVDRLWFNTGLPDRPGGSSTADDGIYSCDLAPPGAGAAGNRTWNRGGNETHLAGVGGGSAQPGNQTFDCHDSNNLAHPGTIEIPGDSDGAVPDSTIADTFTIVASRSWDDDCDGIVDCFRDHDRDTFGTFVRRLAASETTTLDTSCGGAIPADGCIDRVGIDDFFECDNTTLRWAGRGAPTGEFDCHDDTPAADPTGNNAESNDDAYDNDCNGFVTCFADRDNDEFGTELTDYRTLPAGGLPSPEFDTTVPFTAAEQGMLIFPCGPDSAIDAGLDLAALLDPSGVATTTLSDVLAADRKSEQGGDCHDDWTPAHPGAIEVSGDPFDNDCNGFITCFNDVDRDGFGYRDSFDTDISTALAVASGSTFNAFPFERIPAIISSDPLRLTRWPVEAYPEIEAYRADPVERAARDSAVTNVWYDCRQIDDLALNKHGSAVGGLVGLPGQFIDCHDETADAFPGFDLAGGGGNSVRLIQPGERHPASGPDDSTCNGPILCAVDDGAGGVDLLQRYTADDRATPLDDECTAPAPRGYDGVWRCFEPQGEVNDLGFATDMGEIAGDDLDNDCDGEVLCFEDIDGDDVGTVSMPDDGTTVTVPGARGNHFSCTNTGEAPYTGDCHDNRSDKKPKVDPLTAPDRDLGKYARAIRATPGAQGSNRWTTAADGWDDPDCDGVVMCYSPADGNLFDRFTVADCEGDIGGTYFCFPEEVPGNEFDENCDGVVACFYDGDADTFGIEQYKQPIEADRVPVTSPVVTSDPGTYVCAVPSEQLASGTLDGNDALVDPDCDDGNPLRSPSGIEAADVFSLDPALRGIGFNAIGNNIDENCDLVTLCWQDLDNDSWGGGVLYDGEAALPTLEGSDFDNAWVGNNNVRWFVVASATGDCTAPGTATQIGDCHDSTPDGNVAAAASRPGASIIAGDDYDNDCDGFWHCYEDLDQDGYGSPNVVLDDGDRLCKIGQFESRTDDDCLDDNTLTGGQTYPIPAVYDPTTQLSGDPTVAWLSHPAPDPINVYEIYGDGFDEDCDNTELCFIDSDNDGFVDGSQQGRRRDRLNRIGNLVPINAVVPDSGVILCTGSVVVGDAIVGLSPWPLSGALPVGDDPFADPLTLRPVFDCDDSDADINPDALETYYDDIDANCDNQSDFDKDHDGYDAPEFTADRAGCPDDPLRRFQIDPVHGCGVGTDCDDRPSGGDIHPAPFSGDPAAQPLEIDPNNEQLRGIKGDEESCESSGSQIDNDCDGNVNTWKDCYFDYAAYMDQLPDFEARQELLQRVHGIMPREMFTACLQSASAEGNYFVDRTDTLAYQPSDFVDPDPLDGILPPALVDAMTRPDYNDFQYDPNWTPPANAANTRWYRDIDGDTYGDGGRQGVYLCDKLAESISWLTNFEDCNDGNETINARGIELCDRKDNNCNGDVDEVVVGAVEALTPEVDPACVWHYADGDGDSWGMEEANVRPGTSDRYCICPGFEALELNAGVVEDKPAPESCPHFVDGEGDTVFYGHRLGGRCYVNNDRDCDDLNLKIKPFAPNVPPYELIDGVDNDCDHELPLIELDCDNDNAYPFLPKMNQSLLDSPEVAPIESPESVGLGRCSGAPPQVVCWGDKIPVKCNTETGFWVVKTEALNEELFAGASRTARATECSAWDCDDQCPKRCAGLDEGCDGIDNDCNDYADEALGVSEQGLIAEDLDGVPDPMDTRLVSYGLVQPDELDFDGDAHVSCALGSEGKENQTALSGQSCKTMGQFLDCNDLCYLSAPAGPDEEVCNGFAQPDLCVEPSESDDDGDKYRSCGTYGPDAAAPEKVYTLLFTQGDVGKYLSDPEEPGNKLAAVVPLVPPRLYSEEQFQGTSVENQTRECDVELDRQLTALVGHELPTDARERRDTLLDLCVRADTCRVLRERRLANAGQEETNNQGGNLEPHTGDLPLPIVPPTGLSVEPDYCEAFQDSRCSVVELTITNDRDRKLYTEADDWRTKLEPGDPRNDNACVKTPDMSDAFHPEQAVTRTVWSRDQIVAARKLVVDFECYRMYGTFGCDPKRTTVLPGDESWVSPYLNMRAPTGGFFPLPDVPTGVINDHPEWWIYLNRFTPASVDGVGTLVGCWGDPRQDLIALTDGAATIDEVGGDCKSSKTDKEKFDPVFANRGASEGPGDLMARYLAKSVDCSTCLDDVDNNCNGMTDADDPACAQCFVGQGYGCGCSAGGDRGSLGRTASPVLVLSALLLAFIRRRERA
jgi:hypothetical protein